MCQRVWLTGCTVVVAALLSAGNARADSGVQIFYAGQSDRAEGAKSYPINHDAQQHIRLIRRPIGEPSASVGRAISEQRVHRHLGEMVVVNQRVLFDPTADYYRQEGGNSIDDNHSLLKAQRLYFSLNAPGVSVIRGGQEKGTDAAGHIQPRMIIIKPAAPPRLRSLPTAPAPPKDNQRQMAAAD